MSSRRINNLLFFAIALLLASMCAKQGPTVATTNNDSAQSNAVYGNCLYGKVSKLTANIDENIDYLLETCDPATLAYLQQIVNHAKVVGHLLSLNHSNPNYSAVIDQIDALGNYQTWTTPLRSTTDSTLKLSQITNLVSHMIQEAESNSLIAGKPIQRHVAILLNNAVTSGYFANSTAHVASNCLTNEFDWFLTPTVTNLSGYISQLSSMGSLNTINEVTQSTSLNLVNNDAVKAGVAVAFWFSHASEHLANTNNLVFELKANNDVLVSISVKKNENYQNELVIQAAGNASINSFLAKCPDYNFVLVSIQEDCEDVHIHVVIRNLLNNAREHWTFSFKATNVNSFSFNTYPLDSSSIAFKKYNDFAYTRQLEENIFGKSITSTLRRSLLRDADHCKLPDNCAYYHTTCIQCNEDFLLFEEECQTECPSGTFEYGNVCEHCHVNCAECVGITSDDCTKCDKNISSPNALISALSLVAIVDPAAGNTNAPYGVGPCEANCPQGSFKKIYTVNEQSVEVNDHAVCTDCENGCLECSSETNCTKCESPINENGIDNFYHLFEGDCVDECENGTYLDQVDNSCKPCTPTNCETCSNATNCTVCENGYPLHNNQCGSCPNDHWDNNNVCESCLDGCIECSNGTDCERCDVGLRLVDKDAENSQENDSCVSNCENGYGEVSINNVESCGKCSDVNCDQCNGSVDVCKKCNSSTYLHEGECLSECPDPYYERDSDRTCQECNETCASCSEADSCDTCFGTLVFKEGECLIDCPDFWINVSGICIECEESGVNCLKCKSANSELCTKCKSTHWLHLDTEQCIESCDNNKYPFNLAAKECKNCSDANCHTCPSNSCNLCQSGYHWNGSSCTNDCGSGYDAHVNGTFFSTYNSNATVCKPCSVTNCASCDNDQGVCDECSGTVALYNNTCNPNCPNDTFESVVNGVKVCVDCPENCLTCESLEECTSCTATTVLNGSLCETSCDEHETPVDGVCTDCSNNCDVCHQVPNTTSTICDACISPSVLHNGTCHDNCPEKMFSDHGVCNNCSPNCQHCLSLSVCDVCIDEYSPITINNIVSCVTDCGPRRTEVESLACKNCVGAECSKLCNETVCEDCVDTSCLVCSVNQTNNCEECDQTSEFKYLQEITLGNSTVHVCKDSCDSGFLPNNNNICLPCKVGCALCSGTADNCSACLEDYFLLIDATPNTCEASCPDYTYELPGEPVCQNCTDNINCLKCNPLDPDECLDCATGTYNYNGSCLTSCSNGKKIVNENGEDYCRDCINHCNLCDNSTCDNCKAGFYKKVIGEVISCVFPCGNGYVENLLTGNCDKCTVDNCKVCNVATLEQCEECLGSDKVQVGGQSCGSCEGPTYVSDDAKSCVSCADENCELCDRDGCNKCNSPFKLLDDVCVEFCPEGQIGVLGECQPCAPENCGFCTGTNESDCFMCSNGLHLHTWIEQTAQGPVTRKLCKDECPNGEFSLDNVDTFIFKGVLLTINNQCNHCPNKCIKCNDATTCTLCTEETTLHNGSCPDECPDNQIEIENQCEQCTTGIADCVECDLTKNNCIDCRDINLLSAAGEIVDCITECETENGYYLDGRNCKPCIANCDQCSNSTTCNVCSQDFFLQTESPVCDDGCGAGEYGENRQCNSCSVSNCNSCPLNNCISCNGNLKLKIVLEANSIVGQPPIEVITCNDDCGNGFFENGSNCSPCEDNCLRCDDATTCTHCNSTHYLYNDDCLEECDAPLTEIHNSLNGNSCQRCHVNCAECAVDDVNNCSKCVQHYFLLDSSCVSDCGDGKIEVDSNLTDEFGGVCENCTVQNCLNCSPDASTCIECSGDLYLKNNICVEDCDDGYSATEIRPRVCNGCQVQNCADCQGNTSNCDKCASTYTLLIPELGDPECLPNCPTTQGYWKKENTSIEGENYFTCEKCPATCSTCRNEGNLPVCDSCKETYFLKEGACIDECGNGLYESSVTRKCEACPLHCKECPAGVCIECNLDYFLQERIHNQGLPEQNSTFHCVNSCDDYFYETANSTCAQCETGCIDCLNSVDCDRCVSPYYLKNDDCVIDCEDKYFEVENPERVCNRCNDENCKICNSNGVCEVCIEGFNLLNDTKVCHAPDCPINYYQSENKCYRCSDSNCISCPSNSCKHCTGIMVLLDGECENSCGERKVPLSTPGFISKVCNDCPLNCDECEEHGIGEKKCTSCISPHVLNHLNQCVLTCTSGQYPSQQTGECEVCTVPYCDSCPDDSCEICQETVEGDLLSLFTDPVSGTQVCDDSCPLGFTDVAGNCEPCHDENCARCTEPNTCNQCETDYLYFISNESCQPKTNCGDGKYEYIDLNGRRSCADCKSTCATCSNGETCNSCPEGKSLKNNQCTDDCGENHVSENNICVPCHEANCETCSSSLAGACQECFSPNVLRIDGTCHLTCQPSQFNNNGICTNCSTNCVDCDSLPICNQCNSENVLNKVYDGLTLVSAVCVEDCPTGKFAEDGVCHKCSDSPANLANCSNCDLPQNFNREEDTQKCNTCSSGYLYEGECTSHCPSDTYISGDICIHCGVGCNSCERANDCQECNSPYFLHENRCEESCPNRFFKNTTTRTCDSCSSNCILCTDATDCDLCDFVNGADGPRLPLVVINQDFLDHLTNLGHEICISSCPTGYFLDNRGQQSTCTKCSSVLSNCAECSSADTCDACQSGSVLQGTTCHSSCESGSVAVGSICKPCHESCEYCLSDNRDYCTQCKNPALILHEGTCSTGCPLKHYISGTSCVKCGPNCADCDADGCNICETDYFLYENLTCDLCTKSSGLVQITELNINKCVECQTLNCNTCEQGSPEVCEVCDEDFRLYNDLCYNPCPAKTYNLSLNECEDCPLECALCSSPENCSKCIVTHFLIGEACESSCPNGYYENETDRTCDQCNDNHCNKCANGVDQICTECKPTHPILFNNLCTDRCEDPFYESGGQCLPCGVGCERCNSNGYCLDCDSDHLLQDGKCVVECESGFYETNEGGEDFCKECSMANCDSCNANECHICEEGTYLKQGECVLNCGDGFWLNEDTSECKECPEGCAKCTSLTHCTHCENSHFLQANNICENTCPLGQVGNPLTRLCEDCQTNCARCTAGENSRCYLCKTPFIFQDDECVTKCTSNYFHDEFNNICHPCSDNCSHCTLTSEGEKCLSCLGDYILESGKCRNPCPSSHTMVDGECVQCFDHNCEDCGSNTKKCNRCSELSGLYLLKGSCVDECPDGYYEDSENGNRCLPCQNDCDRCHKDGQTLICDLCENGFFMHQGNCYSNCPETGTYPHCDTRKCEECDESCQSCYDGQPDNCITCASTYFLSFKNCVKNENCPVGKFGHEGNCVFCSVNNCDKCSDLETCDVCQEGFVLEGSSTCKLASSYFSVIGRPKVFDKSGALAHSVVIQEDLPELASSHKAISLTFWLRLINSRIVGDGFWPIISINNVTNVISFGLRRENGAQSCVVKSGETEVSLAGCSFDNLQEWNFFTLSLIVVDTLQVNLFRTTLSNSTLQVSSGSLPFIQSVIHIDSSITFNSLADQLGAVEITKMYLFNYQLKQAKIAPFQNDIPNECDYYCSLCNSTCNTCSNGSILPSDWRCPAGGFNYFESGAINLGEESISLAADVTHNLSSDIFQLNLWILPKEEEWSVSIKSQNAPVDSLDVVLTNNSVEANGIVLNQIFEVETWYHISIKVSKTNIRIDVHDINGSEVSNKSAQANFYRRLYSYSEIDLAATTGSLWIDKVYLLINNTTDEIKEIRLAPNCVNVDENYVCVACSENHQLNSHKQCIFVETGPEYVQLNPSAFTVISDNVLAINDQTLMSSNSYTLSFWFRKLIASHYTEDSLEYDILNLVKGNNEIENLVRAVHQNPPEGYEFKTDIVSGGSTFTQDLEKSANSYSEWLRVLVIISSPNNVSINVYENDVRKINEAFVLNNGISSFKLGSLEQEVNTQFAKIHIYSSPLEEVHHNNEAQPVPCDALCKTCDWENGQCQECDSGSSGDPNPDGSCPVFFVGFKSAYFQSQLSNSDYEEVQHLSSYDLSPHLASSSYSVIGSFTHYHIVDNELPDGDYVIFNLTDNYEGRVTNETTTEHLISFQVNYHAGLREYSFLLNDGMALRKIVVNLEILYGDQLLIHASVDVLTKTFKYYILNHRLSISDEDIVHLTSYPERLVSTGSLRIFGSTNGKSVEGLFTEFYLIVNSFFKDSYVTLFETKLNPTCEANCAICSYTLNNVNVCHSCDSGFNLVGDSCVGQELLPPGRILLQGDLVQNISLATSSDYVVSALHLSYIRQISLFVRRNYFSNTIPVFAKFGNVSLSYRNTLEVSQLQVSIGTENIVLDIENHYAFLHVRIFKSSTGITVRVMTNLNSSVERSSTQNWNTVFSSSLIQLSNEDNQVQIYGVELNTNATAQAENTFRNLDCRADFTYCENNVIILPTGPFELGDLTRTKVHHFEPFRSSIPYIQGNDQLILKLRDFIHEQNNIRSNYFSVTFLLNLASLPAELIQIVSLRNNQSQIGQAGLNHPFLEILFNRSNKQLVVRTKVAVSGSDNLQTDFEEVVLNNSISINYAYINVEWEGAQVRINTTHGGDLQNLITLPHENTYVNESTFMSFFENTASAGNGSIENFYFDYNVTNYRTRDAVKRNNLVSQCTEHNVGDLCISANNFFVTKYNRLTPGVISFLDQEDHIIKLKNETGSPQTLTSFSSRFWFRNSTYTVVNPILLARYTFAPNESVLELSYKNNAFYFNFDGELHEIGINVSIIQRWVSVYISLEYTQNEVNATVILKDVNDQQITDTLINTFTFEGEGGAIFGTNDQTSILIGDLGGELHSFIVYNFVAIYNAALSANDNRPVQLNRSCQNGTPDQQCLAPISTNIQILDNQLDQTYTYSSLTSITELGGALGGYFYAPSFGVTYKVSNLNVTTLDSANEILFEVAGFESVDVLSARQGRPTVYNSGQFTIGILSRNRIYVKRQNVEIIGVNFVNFIPGSTISFFIHAMYDNLTNRVVFFIRIADYYQYIGSSVEELNPITHASLVYKKPGVGEVSIDVNGIELEALEEENVTATPLACNINTTNATKCHFVAETSRVIPVACRTGYTLNRGVCELTNTIQ